MKEQVDAFLHSRRSQSYDAEAKSFGNIKVNTTRGSDVTAQVVLHALEERELKKAASTCACTRAPKDVGGENELPER